MLSERWTSFFLSTFVLLRNRCILILFSVFSHQVIFCTFELIAPTCKVSNVIRLGTSYGGWVIPDVFSSKSVCYCVGAGEDISFDVELIKKYGCEVYTIDPTPRSLAHFNYIKKEISAGKTPFTKSAKPAPYIAMASQLAKLHFLPIGVWDSDSVMRFYVPQNVDHISHSILNIQKTDAFFEAPCKKISTIMQELGHDHIDLLKLDIEGSEYRVLENIVLEGVSVGFFCVEFHEADNYKMSSVRDFLNKHRFEIIFQEGKNITFVRKE